MLGIQNLHKTDIGFMGKHRVNFDFRAKGVHWSMLNSVNLYHGMRIPHRHSTYFDLQFIHLNRIICRGLCGSKRNFFGFEYRLAHINGNKIIVTKMNMIYTTDSFYTDRTLKCEAFVEEKLADTTCSIPTLLNLFSILIIDLVIKIDVRLRCRSYNQNLITAYTQPTISHPAQLLATQTDILINGIEYHEIITQSVHFCKL